MIPRLVFEEDCRCKCHFYRDFKHIKPCCFLCELCNKNIATEMYDQHISKHSKVQGKVVNETLSNVTKSES